MMDKEKRRMIRTLARDDFRSRYAVSQLGIFWAFFRPLMMACVYILVFSVIARSAPAGNDYPYAMWMLPGLIVWFAFSDSVSSGVTVLKGLPQAKPQEGGACQGKGHFAQGKGDPEHAAVRKAAAGYTQIGTGKHDPYAFLPAVGRRQPSSCYIIGQNGANVKRSGRKRTK